jgi:arylsulfatase A-like enzyme
MDACHRLASKGRFYEQSVRVPLLLKYPRAVPPGQVDDKHLVSSGIDVLPTLCDFAGIAVPESVQGRSLRPIAEGRAVDDWRTFVVTENHTGRMLRTQRFKYCVYNVGTGRESLVDLMNDPGEMRNLSRLPKYRAVMRRHRSLLTEWIAHSGDTAAESFAVSGNEER